MSVFTPAQEARIRQLLREELMAALTHRDLTIDAAAIALETGIPAQQRDPIQIRGTPINERGETPSEAKRRLRIERPNLAAALDRISASVSRRAAEYG